MGGTDAIIKKAILIDHNIFKKTPAYAPIKEIAYELKDQLEGRC